jgi:hypothetical protein
MFNIISDLLRCCHASFLNHVNLLPLFADMAVVDQLYLFRTLLYAIWCADFDDVSKHQSPFRNFTKIKRRHKRVKNPGLCLSSPQ